jgi:ATP-dependent RNA helicase DDX24/MAK5
MSQEKQERVLRKGPDIVVATPGRLWELIKEGNVHLQQVDDIP